MDHFGGALVTEDLKLAIPFFHILIVVAGHLIMLIYFLTELKVTMTS